MKESSLGVDKKELEKIYKDATKTKFNFLKVDLQTPEENMKFSHNFTDFYRIEDSDRDND
jgi:hypothetical protein